MVGCIILPWKKSFDEVVSWSSLGNGHGKPILSVEIIDTFNSTKKKKVQLIILGILFGLKLSTKNTLFLVTFTTSYR